MVHLCVQHSRDSPLVGAVDPTRHRSPPLCYEHSCHIARILYRARALVHCCCQQISQDWSLAMPAHNESKGMSPLANDLVHP